MIEYTVAIVMYLLGALFMTMHFEPQEDAPKIMYIFFVFAWPVMTLWFLLNDFFGSDEE